VIKGNNCTKSLKKYIATYSIDPTVELIEGGSERLTHLLTSLFSYLVPCLLLIMPADKTIIVLDTLENRPQTLMDYFYRAYFQSSGISEFSEISNFRRELLSSMPEKAWLGRVNAMNHSF
jgi:hypothetical protein